MTIKVKLRYLTNILFTEKINLAVLGSRFCKVNNIFYIGKISLFG